MRVHLDGAVCSPSGVTQESFLPPLNNGLEWRIRDNVRTQ